MDLKKFIAENISFMDRTKEANEKAVLQKINLEKELKIYTNIDEKDDFINDKINFLNETIKKIDENIEFNEKNIDRFARLNKLFKKASPELVESIVTLNDIIKFYKF